MTFEAFNQLIPMDAVYDFPLIKIDFLERAP
jgi:hypothetical protein